MPRKGPVPKREILPDPIYNSRLVARFVNRLMYDGKKGPAETIVYRALENLSEKSGEEALRAFDKALDNVKGPPIRCPWKCGRNVKFLLPFVGSSPTPAPAEKRAW